MPSNPNANPLWESIDENLNANNASKYVERYESDRQEGLNVKKLTNDDRVNAQVQMARDGYGEATASGFYDEDNTSLDTVKTGTNQVRATINANEEELENPWKQKLDLLSSSFIKMFNKFKPNSRGSSHER